MQRRGFKQTHQERLARQAKRPPAEAQLLAADLAREPDALFDRSQAAIIEARRLVEINLDWQARTYAGVRRIHLRAIFEPKDIPLKYPQELWRSARSAPYQPFPFEDND